MKRQLVKSCCGGSGYIFELDAPVLKSMLPKFMSAGYKTSDVYTRVGVFFVSREGLIASGPFGGTKIKVRCSGSTNCSQLLDNLENTFKMAQVAQESGP